MNLSDRFSKAFWFISQFFNGVASLSVTTEEMAGIAYWVHISGFVAGLVLVWLFQQFWEKKRGLKHGFV